ncbi:MAG: peptidase C14 [Roseateles depolymerans]|uniref:Peptidase C14 n=1 Tax=Roseateles depolymerans TaxID=76731 RepID=A0A2W5DAF3_9BURK|nr:MAG: peptidase C14 [Roseateles depolymerans]
MSRRLNALVIGNAAYEAVDALKNPVNDAEDVGAKLETCGFTVIRSLDSDHADMDRALKKFQRVLKDSDVGLFFFAGHGMQIDGENYLAAVDTDGTDEIAAKHSSLALNRVIEVMEKSGCSTSIIVLDACRNNPFERAWTRSMESRGLAPVYAPRGTLIAFATSPGQTASDGRGRNGAYTAALLQHMTTPDCSIETMFKRVRNTLSAATKGRQISWEHTSLAGEFFFNLSLGLRIDLYAETSLSDSLFVLDDAKTSHRVIRELKSSTWPRQNPAVDGFTADVANKASADSLFVVGRNLYQAACGGSHSAMAYLRDFASRSSGIKEPKRKALLDGMLFEVFYDPNGKLRKQFKLRQFEPLFALQRHKDLLPSFDFIAECLLPEAARFYSIPGKRHEVVVDVATHPSAKAGHHVLDSVHCDGASILWLEDEDYAPEPGESPERKKLTLEQFELQLAEQMLVAPHLLKVNYVSFEPESRDTIAFPLGWSTRRR